MPERIYNQAGEGRLEPLEEMPFDVEKKLQALIAAHPELLDGEQISPGNERRWILIKPEKGIASSAGEAARWLVDHLIIDQDAIPTLVEVKKGDNSEIRRKVVGQMLEYAAHAAESWTADELRKEFEEKCVAQSLDPATEIATLLNEDGDPDIVNRFWEDVATNLIAKRLRLLFVADEIPDTLARIVTFLNAQMPRIEVLAVEIKRFQGESTQILVPRVIGRTSAALARRQSASAQKLTREAFLEGFASVDVREFSDQLLEVAEQPNCYVYYGTSGVSIRAICPVWPRHLSVAWLYPRHATGWMRTRNFSFGVAIYDNDFPKALRETLDLWVDQFAKDTFAENVSSKDTKAWAVSHEDAVKHQDILADRLRKIISELTALRPEFSDSQ